MIKRDSQSYVLLKIISILFGIQVIRIIINLIIFQFVDKSALNSDIITLSEMLLFTVLILWISRKRNINLSIFPHNQRKGIIIRYFIITVVVLFIIISTPIFSGGFSFNIIITLALSTIATPIFEEVIFRGYVWNELKHYYRSEIIIYILNTILFAIWHIGYVDNIGFKIALRGDITGLPFIVFMKVTTGLCFGIIIGFARYKLKNCYAAILLHSFMNAFGR